MIYIFNMCGRYTLTDNGEDIWKLIERALPKEFRKGLSDKEVSRALSPTSRRKYNIVPTSVEPILYLHDGNSVFSPAHWWLLPSWGKDQVTWRISKVGEKTFTWKEPRKSHFNSRWDTVTSPSNKYWNGLLDTKRCLIPADGFMEWPDDELRDKDKDKIPNYFTLHEHRPFFFAGIYDETTDDEGNPFVSYNIITVEPNALLKALPHHRMPAILSDESAGQWLSSTVHANDAAKLLKPTLDKYMVSYPISKLVNAAKNESPSVIMPLGAES